MPEHPSGVRTDVKPHRSLFERLTALISPEPENRAELLDVLHDAHERKLIDADALSMIEGVFQVSDLCARDIMIPRSQMDVIDISKPIEEWMPEVLSTAHSRFPAIEGERDDISGLGQTKAALTLAKSLPADKKKYLMAKSVGHYGIFNGRKWRDDIAPVVETWIRANGG